MIIHVNLYLRKDHMACGRLPKNLIEGDSQEEQNLPMDGGHAMAKAINLLKC